MTFLQSLILGIIQGLTEYLPVSSSAHLVLVPYLLNWSFPREQIFPFDVLVQLGTLVAVILYFWKDLTMIIKSFFKGLVNKEPFKDPNARLGWYLILATIPAILVGLLIKSQVEAVFSNPQITALFLFGTATLLMLADWLGQRTRQLDTMTWWDALWIGLFQAISIFPGISRSGATITGGMTRNFDRTSSARFSFLMSIPVMLGAGLVSVKDLLEVPALGQFLPILAVGFVAAAIVGYLSIHWFLSFIKRQKLWYFAVYCVCLAIIVLIIGSIRNSNGQTNKAEIPAANNSITLSAAPASSNVQIIRVQYSNSLEWLLPAMTSCANLLPSTGLVVHTLPAENMTLENTDLNLIWGVPDHLAQSTFEIGSERLVIAVNANTPLQTLPLNVARQLFNGEINTWGQLHTTCPDCFTQAYKNSIDGETISLNFYSPDEDIQDLFIQKIMGSQAISSASGWLIPSVVAMQESLANNPSAIGFIPAHLLNSNLKEISLGGFDTVSLNSPILAISPVEPQGITREWLVCLQKILNP
ncbi:MAG: undecaprenyl-diphosphatase UppP [Anaerolineaceae bacterium]